MWPFNRSNIEDVQNVVKETPTRARVSEKVVARELSRTNQNVAMWRKAIITAEGVLNPRRTELYNIYKDVVLDAHLSALMNTLKLKVSGSKFWIVDKDGEENEELTKSLRATWFQQYMEIFVDSIFYGHSLIQIGGYENGKFVNNELIPRENVVPEHGIVKASVYDHCTVGTPYRETPYINWLIEIGEKKDLGILAKAAPLVLWKKGVFGNWSHFSELFGMPVRIGKTDILSPEMKTNMENMLKNMTSASYAVIGNDDVLEFIESHQTDAYQVYSEMILLINSELSKLVLNQTGTTDEKAFTGSANVHLDILNQTVTSIKSKFERHFMDHVIPKMIYAGIFPDDGSYFKWDNSEQVSKIDQFDMVDKLLKNGYKIDAEWIEETFNIPVNETEKNNDGTVIQSVENLYKGLL
jgi:hypothetical protein